jgi:hypothetical protein
MMLSIIEGAMFIEEEYVHIYKKKVEGEGLVYPKLLVRKSLKGAGLSICVLVAVLFSGEEN